MWAAAVLTLMTLNIPRLQEASVVSPVSQGRIEIRISVAGCAGGGARTFVVEWIDATSWLGMTTSDLFATTSLSATIPLDERERDEVLEAIAAIGDPPIPSSGRVWMSTGVHVSARCEHDGCAVAERVRGFPMDGSHDGERVEDVMALSDAFFDRLRAVAVTRTRVVEVRGGPMDIRWTPP